VPNCYFAKHCLRQRSHSLFHLKSLEHFQGLMLMSLSDQEQYTCTPLPLLTHKLLLHLNSLVRIAAIRSYLEKHQLASTYSMRLSIQPHRQAPSCPPRSQTRSLREPRFPDFAGAGSLRCLPSTEGSTSSARFARHCYLFAARSLGLKMPRRC